METLKLDWKRFKDGKVILDQVPDSICGVYKCEAEILKVEGVEDSEGVKGAYSEGAKGAEAESAKAKSANCNSKKPTMPGWSWIPTFGCKDRIDIHSDDDDSTTQNIHDDSTNNDLLESLPSGKGELILTARYTHIITLYHVLMCILCSKLYWISIDNLGWSIDYKNVLLHAISKPANTSSISSSQLLTTSDRPHIYLQLSCDKLIDSNFQEIKLKSFADDSADDDSSEEDDKFVEVKLYVENDEIVDDIFVALSECASLHPCDSEESEDDTDHGTDTDLKRNKIDLGRFEDASEN